MIENQNAGNRYCVIGAGAAGLTTCRAFLQHGIPFDCYERESDVGGIFNYGAPNSSVYQSTHLLSSKPTTQYPDFPMPAEYPPCPHHRLVHEYFRSYAQHFGLRDHIHFNTGVAAVTPAGTAWRVRLTNGREQTYRGVIICNGHHWDPVMPTFRGTFAGDMLHSKTYKTPDILAGKRVLVVGAGNSACDIASDAVGPASRVLMSIRRPVHFIPKYSLGKPGDVTAQKMVRLGVPMFVMRLLAKLGSRVINGRPEVVGLPVPKDRIFDSTVTVSTLVPYHVRQGDIAVKPGIESLDGRYVNFVDGSREQVDTIVCATGFRISFPFIDQQELNSDDGSPRLYLHQFHPHRDDLAVIGLFQSATGGHWRLMHFQAQLLARQLSAIGRGQDISWFHQLRLKPPEDLRHGYAMMESQRHQYTVEPVRFERRLTNLIREFDQRYGLPTVTPTSLPAITDSTRKVA